MALQMCVIKYPMVRSAALDKNIKNDVEQHSNVMVWLGEGYSLAPANTGQNTVL